MAGQQASNDPLTHAMRLVTSLLKARNTKLMAAEPSPDPVDCDVLLDMIQAAQAVYTEHCAIAKSE